MHLVAMLGNDQLASLILCEYASRESLAVCQCYTSMRHKENKDPPFQCPHIRLRTLKERTISIWLLSTVTDSKAIVAPWQRRLRLSALSPHTYMSGLGHTYYRQLHSNVRNCLFVYLSQNSSVRLYLLVSHLASVRQSRDTTWKPARIDSSATRAHMSSVKFPCCAVS